MKNIKNNFNNNRTIIFLSFLLTMIIFLKLSLWWSDLNNYTSLKQIILSETNLVNSSEYYKLVENNIGDDLNEINIKKMNEILKKHPYIKTTRISKVFPSRLKIELIERDPIALINIKPMVLIDTEGYVMPNIRSTKKLNLPIMTNFNSDLNLYPLGERVLSENVKKISIWLKKIKFKYPSLYENISEMKITTQDNITMILSNYPTNINLGRENIWTKIKILKKFENELLPKTLANFSYLDMRYENQIIAMNRKI